jgi:hypothetical protein
MKRSSWLTDDIGSRVKRGEQWRRELDVHKALALDSRYIRILGRGFRAICVAESNPCGRLLNQKGKAIPYRDKLADAIADARSAPPQNSTPAADKCELRAQAKFIKSAMQNGLRFDQELEGLPGEFDQIIFVTDELAIRPQGEGQHCRADMVALARLAGQERYCPIFIELKAKRSLGRLMDQLNLAQELLWQNTQARSHLIEFLSAVSGIATGNIENSDAAAQKMLIWPRSESGQESKAVGEARKGGVHFVEFKFTRSPAVMANHSGSDSVNGLSRRN